MRAPRPAPGPAPDDPSPAACGRPGPVCEIADELGSAGADRPGFRWLVLPRHGRRPLAVRARALLQADNRCAGLPYWSEIALYETAAARLAATLCHTAPPGSGPAWRDAFLGEDAAAIRAAIHAHDPLWAASPDPAAVACLRLAWAGLLGAVFGRDQPAKLGA